MRSFVVFLVMRAQAPVVEVCPIGALQLRPAEVRSLALHAGFPPRIAAAMTEIAKRESFNRPASINSQPPDLSYGLWQINMRGALGPARRRELGLKRNEDLLNPLVNARAAYSLWRAAGMEPSWDRSNEMDDTEKSDVLKAVEGLTPVDLQALADYQRTMNEDVIPEIRRVVEERRALAAESRDWQLKC